MQRAEAILLGQRGHLFPWVPVFLGLGIATYFALPAEPDRMFLGFAAVIALLAFLAARYRPSVAPLFYAAALLAAGFAWAGTRAHLVAGPQIEFRYYGPVEGRIVDIDRSASGAVRLTLDRVVLRDMPPRDTPHRVRIALHSEDTVVAPEPGLTVIMTAHLSVSNGPVEPGGFDFRRHAWFQRLGAVGYTRLPVLALAPSQQALPIFRARMALSERIRDGLPGQTGAFAAAILTGDRSGLSPDSLSALRASNLAHLLAISGLHMGLLAGFVFAVLRLVLLLAARRISARRIKKLAAFGALLAAFGYLLLSGGNVATERAFVMVAVALGAVMADRRALSLRAVALAALIVLAMRPEAMLGPGFQMSFAATTALVVVFTRLWPAVPNLTGQRRWVQSVLGVVASSAVAGAATAPIAMAHFNMVAHFGLLANVVSVPLMGILVIPAGVVAVLAMPFGLDHVPLTVMGWGLRWIEGVAQWVSSLPGAVGHVPGAPGVTLGLIVLGGLVVCLWQGRGALTGLMPAVLGVWLWVTADRPDVLISSDGGLAGIMMPEGRALSRSKGQGFVAEAWLENDGDGADQMQAQARWAHLPDARVERAVAAARLGPVELVHLQGKTGARGVTACRPDQILISNVDLAGDFACTVYDAQRLRDTGSVALFVSDTQVRARSAAGRRLWHGKRAQYVRIRPTSLP